MKFCFVASKEKEMIQNKQYENDKNYTVFIHKSAKHTEA